jgi:CRISPR-associated exonuclease Cas4
MPSGTQINYYLQCHRKLWLFANGLSMEHTSDLVYEGRLVHENSYPQRSDKYTEIEVEGIKIDYFDTRNNIIHEIKKSDSRELAHEWQLKYYIYVLRNNGIDCNKGILEYPRLRKTEEVLFSDIDKEKIEIMLLEISRIIENEQCPDKLRQQQCKNCSYFDFCWSGEELP